MRPDLRQAEKSALSAAKQLEVCNRTDLTTAHNTPPGQAKFEFRVLQALRAVAALLVVVYHVNQSFFGNPRYWTARPLGNFFEFGHAGVEFFFVLSGFIMYQAHRRDIGRPDRVKSFLWRRFRRIYPIYWAVLLAVILLFFAFPWAGQGIERDPLVIIASVLLVHVFGQAGQVLLVSWTLFHEILFYGLFALMIFDRRYGMAALAAWLAGSVGSLLCGASLSGAMQFYFSPLHLLFGMGIAAAWVITTRRMVMPLAAAVLGAAAFLGIGMEEVYGSHLTVDGAHVLYGIASAFVLLGGVELERSGRLRVPLVLVFLGDASYSIYLCHDLALSALAKVGVLITGMAPIPLIVVYLGMVVAASAAGVMFHLVVEVPMLALLKPRKMALAAPMERSLMASTDLALVEAS